MQASDEISSTEEQIPLYRAFKAIANAGQVTVDEIQASVEQAVTNAAEPLVTEVADLPAKIGISVEGVIQPVAISLDTLTKSFGAVPALVQAIYSQVVFTQTLGDDVDEACIQDAFEFIRALNQIDDLVADQKFKEPKKDNSARLQSYKDTKTFTGCVAILERRFQAGQLTESEKTAVENDFSSLFERIENNLQVRAQRLLDVQAFRRKILDFFFFSGRCQHEQPVASEQTATQ